MTHQFEPRIVGFLCNWCSYAGADLAGVSRFQYPANIRIIRVMCSGRVDPVLIIEAFLHGVDGVLIAGCHPGDCHYISGNLQAERKIKLTKRMLALAGFQPERLRLEWVSASEGQRFAEIVKEFTAELSRMGQSNADKLRNMLEAARDALADFRLRALVSKERTVVEEGNVYGERKSQQDFDALMATAAGAELLRKRIATVAAEPKSVKELAAALSVEPQCVLEHVIVMRRKNIIGLAGVEGYTPRYVALIPGVR